MKKLLLFISLSVVSLLGCKNEGWSEEDQKTFMDDCINASNGAENSIEVCNCGLQKAMEVYSTKKEATEAMQTMSERDIMLLYEDCFDGLDLHD